MRGRGVDASQTLFYFVFDEDPETGTLMPDRVS